MSDAIGIFIAALPAAVALSAGIARWRAWRYPRRAVRRVPVHVRLGTLLALALAFGACHSIERGVFAHGPVPLGDLPFNEPVAFTVGPDAGSIVPAQSGLLASYFSGADYIQPDQGEVLDHQQIDPNIDFVWDASDTNPVIPPPRGIDVSEGDPFLPDHWPIWSTVWEGYLDTPSEGDYGLRLHVNNGGWLELKQDATTLQTVISCPGGSGFEGDCDASVHLTAERHYVRISYYNNAPSVARAMWSWQKPGEADFSIVPPEVLFTQSGGGIETPPEVLASFGVDPTIGLLIAEPVNTFTGNFTLSSVDLEIPGRGLPLRLMRTFNARDTGSGRFGQGWTSNLEWALGDHGATVSVTRGDGRRDRYARNPDGSYAAPSGVFDALVRRADGTFLLSTPDQIRVEFSTTGTITRLADRNDNALTFATGTGGEVTAITDGAGRSLRLRYSESGLLVGATDPADRAFAYAYDGRRLVAVTDAAGATTRYAYDASGRITTVTDALGNVTLRNEYDAQGRVTRQTDAVGGVVSFAYDDATRTTTHTDARGAVTTIAHDAQGRALSVTDATGKAITYTYDARGNRTSFRDRSGNIWRFRYDDRGNRTGVTDPAGGAATFEYDTLNDLTARTDPNGNTWRYTYDARGDLVSLADGEGRATRIVVDASGLPTQVNDADGVVSTLGYDAAGDLTTVTTASGTTENRYDAAGRLVGRIDANRHESTFAYDGMSRLTRTTDPAGNPIAFAYDAAGNLVRITDRRGSTTTFGYDAAQRLVAVTDALAQTTRFAFDPSGNRSAVTDPTGKTVAFAYDLLDRLVSITDPEGGVARLVYDANGNLVTTTDARGASASFTYGFRNQRTSARDRAGGLTAFAYDAAGRLVAVSDPLGATTRFAYDRADRYVATSDALGNATRIAYTPGGRRAAFTDPNGNVTRFAYDAAARLQQVTDALGGQVSFDYDLVGNLSSRTDRLGRRTGFVYDALDRLQSVVDAAGGVSTLGYDENGALTDLVDGNAHTTSYGYDAVGRLVQVTDALGSITRYGYDARGLLTSLADANGHSRAYSYDGNRRLLSETDALGRARSYRYDANGNVVAVTDAKGQATALGYDAEDRLLRIAHADGTAVAYTRDAAGQRLSMVDPLGTTTYAYDALRRLASVTDAFGKTVRYAYDPSGNRSALTYPDGRVASYGYDRRDRLTAVGFAGNVIAAYTYDAVGNPTAAVFANGSRVVARYDALDRLAALTNTDGEGKVASAFTYGYDPVGNVLTETASGARDLNEDRSYSYDALSRLVAVTDRDHKTTRYGYDAAGNRTSVAANDGADALTGIFDAADQLLALRKQDGHDHETFGYDANGNLVLRVRETDRTTFKYDASDRLTDVVGLQGTSAAFTYDGDGNLRTEGHTGVDQAGPGGTTTRSFAYTLDVSGPLTQVLAATDGSDSASYVYGLQRIAAFASRDTRYYGADVRGSARSQTDERGRVHDVASFDAWGVPHDAGEGSAKLATLFGFAGERQDPKSGLVYLRARWYAPDLGRFLTRDPFPGLLAKPITLQAYGYGYDAPTSRVDPSGLTATGLLDQVRSGTGDAFKKIPPGTGFIPVADECSGQILLLPDFTGALSEALFGQRGPSLADLGLIPTLACNEQTQTKPFVSAGATFRCVSPPPTFSQPGRIQVLPNGLWTFTPGAAASTTTAPCGLVADQDAAFFNKATGGKGTATSRAARAGTALRGAVDRLLSDAALREALDDLARMRQRDQIPAINEPGGTDFARARLDVGGQSFYGRNAPEVVAERPPSTLSQTMRHAEGDAFAQAKAAGVSGGHGVLFVDIAPCAFCKSSFGGLAEWLGLDTLDVYTPSGLFGTYDTRLGGFITLFR